MPRLTLLAAPAWDGSALPVGSVTALVTLLAGERGGASDGALVAALWEDPPANPANALQAVVSRARRATTPAAIARTGIGYALALPTDAVDVWELAEAVRRAELALADSDTAAVLTLAEPWLATTVAAGGVGPLGRVRRDGARHVARLRALAGMALGARGEHARALAVLEPLASREFDGVGDVGDVGDGVGEGGGGVGEDVVGAWLRATAAVSGPAAALTQYERVRVRLADATGADPSPELRALHEELLAADRPVRTGVVAPSTEILGREGEQERVRELLATTRLVTLLGPGGIGKTTLAQAAAGHARQPVVRVVQLASVTDPDDVPRAVATGLGLRDNTSEPYGRALAAARLVPRIAADLDGPPTLLVLDNCEQVLDGVATLVHTLLGSCPRLTVLATSRRPLALAAEHVVTLGPLQDDVGAALFTARVEAVRAGATCPDETVREIVTRLDGLPLALELAAAQVRWMSVPEVAAALDARFEVLTGGLRRPDQRHQTLEAVIAWSWDLLDPAAQRALAWLSTFRTSFGRSAAAAVLGGTSVLPLLARLADHSLLVVRDAPEGGGGTRYAMLETIREFGRLRLVERGERAAAEAAVRAWARALADEAAPLLRGPDEVRGWTLIAPERPEIVAVLGAAVADDDLTTVLALARALGQGWVLRTDRGRMASVVAAGTSVARAVVDGRLFRGPDLVASDTAASARELVTAALLATRMRGESAEELAEALDVLGPGDDPAVVAEARIARHALTPEGPQAAALLDLAHDRDPEVARRGWIWLVFLRENDGDLAGAIDAAGEALARTSPNDPPSDAAMVRSVLAQLLLSRGELDRAECVAREALAVLEPVPGLGVEPLHLLLGMVAFERGDLDGAQALLDAVGTHVAGPEALWGRWLSAELGIARGDPEGGLRAYRDVVAMIGDGHPDSSPWWVGGIAGAAIAHARVLGVGALDVVPALGGEVANSLVSMLQGPRVDYPLAGFLLHAWARWCLGALDVADDGVARALALAEAFGVARVPDLGLTDLLREVERRCPGSLAAARAEIGTRRGPELRAEALALALATRGFSAT